MDASPPRSPGQNPPPAYPPLSAQGAARRRFLKLCALSTAAAALGLELTGCPSSGGGGGGGGTGWLPWQEPERLAGAPPMRMGQPVAVVVGGGPIAVTFKDGVKKEVVVAAVLTPHEGVDAKADVVARTDAHAKVIREVAAALPSTVLVDAKALDAFEEDVLQQLNQASGGGFFDEVSAAEAEREQASPEPAADDDTASPAREQAPRAPSAAAPAPAASGAPTAGALRAPRAVATPVGRRSLKAKSIWVPCRTPGCTTCGA